MDAQVRPKLLNRSTLSFSMTFALVLACAVQHSHGSGDAGFQQMMGESVMRMHAAMDMPFTGDADRDFARMMIPHHQGAIDMAVAELKYGKDERLRRLAQEIIVDQQQEIVLMHLALGDSPAPGRPAPTQATATGEKEP